MPETLAQDGIYSFRCFSPQVRALFSGRGVTREQFPEFVTKAGLDSRKLVLVHQVHGTEVLMVSPGALPAPASEADGLVTDAAEVVLGVKTADCLPVFFEDPVCRAVGVVHAGWRGLQAGVLETAVAKLTHAYGSRPADLTVGIGPAIRGCCYEVGPEFRALFPDHYREGRRSGSGPGGFLDPVREALSRLVKAGIAASRITDSGYCTVCRNDLFYSFRQEKTQERILSVMALTG